MKESRIEEEKRPEWSKIFESGKVLREEEERTGEERGGGQTLVSGGGGSRRPLNVSL